MRFLALATDYDGTLAHDGVTDEPTVEALHRLRQSGRKLILVTGRELPDLESVFPHLSLFHRVVAENGAVVFDPVSREKRVLAQRPPEKFIAELQARNVTGLSVGDVIVATWHPHETAVLEAIRQLGLDLQVIFNKDAVMVLPSGINKMTGLNQALADLKLSRHNIVGVGDAENDHAFLNCCECSVAVSNAVPAVKERADLITESDRGAGVAQLIGRLLEDDLRSLPLSVEKHGILFGRAEDRDVFIAAAGQTVLLCGQSDGGKPAFVAGFVERLTARGYQTCLIDPAGNYENINGLLTIGAEDHLPSSEEVLQLLEGPSSNLIVNLAGVKIQDRPAYGASLLARLQEKRLREGRPHWIIVEEAHRLLPSGWVPAPAGLAGAASLLLVTVRARDVSPATLRVVNVLAAMGKEPRTSMIGLSDDEFAAVTGIAPPPIPVGDLAGGEVAVWFRDSNAVIDRMQSVPGKAGHRRRGTNADGEAKVGSLPAGCAIAPGHPSGLAL